MLSFVLKRSDWREHDQIIILYTLELGRVEVLARGVKKILSKNSSFLAVGNLVEAEIIKGKELEHLGSVQPVLNFVSLPADNRVVLLSSFNLFLMFVTHREKDEPMFKFLYSWLDFLNRVSVSSVVFAIDVFVIKFLNILGFDLVSEERVGREIKKDMELVRDSNWEIINHLKFEGREGQILHDITYQFCLYHSRQKIDDWAKLAYFSGK